MANPTVEKLKSFGLRHGEKVAMAVAVALCLVFIAKGVTSGGPTVLTPQQVEETAKRAQQQFVKKPNPEVIKQELKQEHRNMEGDPHIKAKLRALRRSFSQNRMISDAAMADVVLVNPTHFAVAIKYERSVGVPMIVARGRDKVAREAERLC